MNSLTSCFQNMPSIIETNHRYIINGQVYNKETMEFEHLNFINEEVVSSQNDPHLLRKSVSTNDVLTTPDWHDKSCLGDMYIIDNEDPTITYVVLNSASPLSSSSTSNTKILAIQTKGKKTSVIWSVNAPTEIMDDSVSNCLISGMCFAGQSKNKVLISFKASCYYAFSGYGNRHNESYVYSFNKIDGTGARLIGAEIDRQNGYGATMYGNTITVLGETGANIYFDLYNGCNNGMKWNNASPGMHELFRYEKSTDKMISIGTIEADEIKDMNGTYSSKGMFKNNFLYFYSYTNMTNPKINLNKIDLTTHKITSEEVNIVFNSTIKELPKMSEANNISSGIPNYRIIIKEHGGKKYLHIFGSCTCYKEKKDIVQDFRAITTFLIDDNNFELTAQNKYIPYEDSLMQGYVESLDDNFMVVTNRIVAKVIKFNPLKGRFEEIQTIDIQNNAIGVDSNNNIWIADSNWALKKFNLELPTKIEIAFEEKSYDYKGENINTNIIISAFNYNNENIEVELELTLGGPAEFISSEKTMKVSTSTEGELEVPIVITGTGAISVYPKVIFK